MPTVRLFQLWFVSLQTIGYITTRNCRGYLSTIVRCESGSNPKKICRFPSNFLVQQASLVSTTSEQSCNNSWQSKKRAIVVKNGCGGTFLVCYIVESQKIQGITTVKVTTQHTTGKFTTKVTTAKVKIRKTTRKTTIQITTGEKTITWTQRSLDSTPVTAAPNVTKDGGVTENLENEDSGNIYVYIVPVAVACTIAITAVISLVLWRRRKLALFGVRRKDPANDLGNSVSANEDFRGTFYHEESGINEGDFQSDTVYALILVSTKDCTPNSNKTSCKNQRQTNTSNERTYEDVQTTGVGIVNNTRFGKQELCSRNNHEEADKTSTVQYDTKPVEVRFAQNGVCDDYAGNDKKIVLEDGTVYSTIQKQGKNV